MQTIKRTTLSVAGIAAAAMLSSMNRLFLERKWGKHPTLRREASLQRVHAPPHRRRTNS